MTYCEIGLQASHDYFIAKYLGYDAAMFDGSTHQWSHMNNLPLVRGHVAALGLDVMLSKLFLAALVFMPGLLPRKTLGQNCARKCWLRPGGWRKT